MYGLHRELAVVGDVIMRRQGIDILCLKLNGTEQKGVNYPCLTGGVSSGDLVLVNTTAVDLGLGSGGFHPVVANLTGVQREAGCGPPVAGREAEAGESDADLSWLLAGGRGQGGIAENSLESGPFELDGEEKFSPGHIMKMRYTPLQVRTLSVEEEKCPHREQIESFRDLQGRPVVVLPLHSLLAPLAVVFHSFFPGGNLVYIMTGGGSLSLEFSHTVAELKERGLLAAAVSCGQTFGGDLEAVNIFSALAAAAAVGEADMIVVGMGPGIAGTGTELGFSGTENVFSCYAARVLGGRPFLVPRISLADGRLRHYVISHHTETILNRLLDFNVEIVFPDHFLVRQNIEKFYWHERFDLSLFSYRLIDKILRNCDLDFRSMGRNYCNDPLFFIAGALPVVACGGL
ncbi:MAG: DUF3866 family protein [Halanaerobiaceae bacterium]